MGTEEKKVKLLKLQESESKKLPESLLDKLSETENVTAEIQSQTKPEIINKRTKFVEAAASDEDFEPCSVSEDFIALETDTTNFKVLDNTDLHSDKFKGQEAWNFREKMLFGKRVQREPRKNQALRVVKQKAAGKYFSKDPSS